MNEDLFEYKIGKNTHSSRGHSFFIFDINQSNLENSQSCVVADFAGTGGMSLLEKTKNQIPETQMQNLLKETKSIDLNFSIFIVCPDSSSSSVLKN